MKKARGPLRWLVIFILAAFPILVAGQEWARVQWVDDGDTVLLTDDRRVRYIGIDAPEMKRDKHPAQAFSGESRQLNMDLVAGREIYLTFDAERYDRYGRTLAYVYLADETFVNLRLVAEGMAYCLPTRPNTMHRESFLEAQRKAMQAGLGIWQAGPEAFDQPCVGHRKSKRFHALDCPFAQKMALRNRVYFSSRWEAFWEGYAPSKGCQK